MASPVVEMWAASETLMGLAATGRLAVTPNEKLTRDDLVLNGEVLTPLLKHLGVRVKNMLTFSCTMQDQRAKQRFPVPLSNNYLRMTL